MLRRPQIRWVMGRGESDEEKIPCPQGTNTVLGPHKEPVGRPRRLQNRRPPAVAAGQQYRVQRQRVAELPLWRHRRLGGAFARDLFIGSEGTLGVITQATLRLRPAPKAVLAGLVFFPSDDQAVTAVERWRATAPARMLEYFDQPSLGLLRARFPEIPEEARAAILFDQEMESEDDPEIELWLERLEGTGALVDDSWFATTANDRERFRRFRHALPELVNDAVRRSGAMKMNTDFAVPLARNREMLAYYRQRLDAEFPGRYVIFGHIGDAHVHVNVFSDPANPRHAAALLTEFAQRAVELGGTVSAEHGVGKRKAHLLALQYAPEHLEAMRAVKRRLDPAGILGRGTAVA
jgi:FAD/FMN-containing dehydrogenase